MLTNIRATVALPPETKCEYGEICWNRWLFPVPRGPNSTMLKLRSTKGIICINEISRARGDMHSRSRPTLRNRKSFHCAVVIFPRPSMIRSRMPRVESWIGRIVRLEWSPALFLCDGGVIAEVDFGVE